MAATPNPRRMFEEYSTLEYLLLGDMRSALEETEDDASHQWLLAVVDALLEALPRKPAALRSVCGSHAATLPLPATETLARLLAEQDGLFDGLSAARADVSDARRFFAERSAHLARMNEWMARMTAHNVCLQEILKPLFDAGK